MLSESLKVFLWILAAFLTHFQSNPLIIFGGRFHLLSHLTLTYKSFKLKKLQLDKWRTKEV